MEGIYMELHVLKRILDGSEEPRNLTLPLLRHITNNFSDERKIAEGGCGEIYKGIFQNGVVAVKKLFNRRTVDDKLFYQEVRSLMRVKHQNIVRFLGYCSNTEQKTIEISGRLVLADMRERLLCFEYINNGSLENHLADELRGHEWHTRYQIIHGICAGLHHLHNEKFIIHMDLKPANILLDDRMVPKITDFGLSRLIETTHTTSTERLLSLGYCAPEYLVGGKMSVKSDIYSLGVIIIELVTGSKEQPNNTTVLRRWRHRWNKAAKHALLEYKQVTKCIELALNCIDKDPLARPSICDITEALNQIENVNSSEDTLEQITSCLSDMLRIEPLELHFPFEPNKRMSCLLDLSNDTDDYFAFNLQTTNPLQYGVQPDKGIIPPGSKCNVTIMLQVKGQAPKSMHCMEDLIVQSTRVGEGLAAMDINKDIFSEKAGKGKTVDKVNLTVVLDIPPSPEHSPMDQEAPQLSAPKNYPIKVDKTGSWGDMTLEEGDMTLEDFLDRNGVVRPINYAEAQGGGGLRTTYGEEPGRQSSWGEVLLEKRRTLGEMTLEEFLVKAGVVQNMAPAVVLPGTDLANTIESAQQQLTGFSAQRSEQARSSTST
ncbi:unnamed protein product [Urochloa humidicola]